MGEKIKGCMEAGEPQLCVWDDPEYTAEDCSAAYGYKSAEQCKADCKLWSPSQAAQYFEAFPDEDKNTVRIDKAELATLRTEHDRLTAEKPLIAAQMLALDQERERMEGENAELREALAQAGWALKLAINGRPVRDADEIFCRIDTVNRAALKA